MIKWIIDLFFKNFWLKMMSILLALVVWAVIQLEEVLERNVRLTVHLAVPDGFKVAGKHVVQKDVTIRGPRVTMSELISPIESHIMLPGRVGPVRVLVGKEYIKNWNDRLKITVHDAYINTYVDEIATKTIPIREVIQGAPVDGYFIEKFTLKPNSVSVTGLKSELKKLNEILTEPIDVRSLQRSTIIPVNLVKPEGYHAEDFSTESTKVTFQIGESKTNSNFGSIRIEVVGDTYETEIKPQFVSIEIQGTPGILSYVKRTELKAYVNVTGLGPGTYQKEIQPKIPKDTVLIETFPEKVTVRIFPHKRKADN